MIVDIVYPIERYPHTGELTTIYSGISRHPGGAVCNVAADLARLDSELPVIALGKIGQDAEGDFILGQLGQYSNIDLGFVVRDEHLKTSFTAVMSDTSTSQRTFFQHRGANAEFDESCIPWDSINPAIMHVGYILLLDALDAEDEQYGTKMAALLCKAKQRGIKTSIDVVSEAGNRFARIVPPALKYADYCIINEVEAEKSTGIQLRDENNKLVIENMKPALAELMRLGVSEWAVIHAPEAGFGMSADGSYEQVDSLNLPEGYIKGTVGAGDAFCSGVLYGAYKGYSLRDAIILGNATAACSLASEGATDGVKSAAEVMEVHKKFSK